MPLILQPSVLSLAAASDASRFPRACPGTVRTSSKAPKIYEYVIVACVRWSYTMGFPLQPHQMSSSPVSILWGLLGDRRKPRSWNLVSLEQCANLLADAANGLAFLSAWQRWRGADLVPTARQVKPEELGRALSSLSIFNVYSRERSAYHLVGAVHENLMGENPTGDDISTKTAKIDLDRRLERLWYAASAPCGDSGGCSLCSAKWL